MTRKQKLAYLFRPTWILAQLKWIEFRVPFFSVKIYLKSFMLPYLYIISVFILAYKFI